MNLFETTVELLLDERMADSRTRLAHLVDAVRTKVEGGDAECEAALPRCEKYLAIQMARSKPMSKKRASDRQMEIVGSDSGEVFVVSDCLELAVPRDHPQVVLGCPETLAEVVIPFGDLRQLIKALTIAADDIV